VEIARGEATAPAAHDAVARMAASRRLAQIDEEATQDFAVRYQLLTIRTNCVLVHRRADVDKATEAARLHQVHSMLAAGWGATATVMREGSFDFAARPSYGAEHLFDQASAPMGNLGDAMNFIACRPYAGIPRTPEPASLQNLANTIVEHLSHGVGLAGLSAYCSGVVQHDSVARAIARAAAAGVEEGQFWLLLAQWVNDRDDGASAAWIEDLVAPFVAKLDPRVVTSVRQIFDDVLGSFALEAWQSTRSRRLGDALERSQGL
jgi:hypothetical protein